MDVEKLIDYFRMLGLEPGVSSAQVKEAYKHCLQAYHPDKFEAGSSSQKWASERLILVKDAYEKLQEFFKENPSGEPPGGWPGAAKQNSGPSDSTDWQTWEQEQSGSFAEEVKAWEQRQQEREVLKQDEHGKVRRSKTLAGIKYGLVSVLVCLWIGKCTNNQWENAKRALEAADWKARVEYQIQTGGTASGAYAVDPRILAQQGNDEAKALTDRWTQEDNERNMGLFFLWVLTAAGAWLWFAPRPKAVFSNWVETGKFDTAELKAAAKEAALQAKEKAEFAARKTVAAAEKLRAEAAKRMEEKPVDVPLDSFKAGSTSQKPTSEEIIAAAARERERMEKEAQEKRQSKTEKAAESKPTDTREMLDELLKNAENKKEKEKK